jgi:hypothetical protein
MEWNGMEWNGMELNGIVLYCIVLNGIKSNQVKSNQIKSIEASRQKYILFGMIFGSAIFFRIHAHLFHFISSRPVIFLILLLSSFVVQPTNK